MGRNDCYRKIDWKLDSQSHKKELINFVQIWSSSCNLMLPKYKFALHLYHQSKHLCMSVSPLITDNLQITYCKYLIITGLYIFCKGKRFLRSEGDKWRKKRMKSIDMPICSLENVLMYKMNFSAKLVLSLPFIWQLQHLTGPRLLINSTENTLCKTIAFIYLSKNN